MKFYFSYMLRLGLLIITVFLSGCFESDEYVMMPTPNLYVQTPANPFDAVPPALRSSRAGILYVTDRLPEGPSADGVKYGHHRSQSMSYGLSEVEFGDRLSWEELVQASRERTRSRQINLRLTRTDEMGRFPETPATMVLKDGEIVESPKNVAARKQEDERFRAFLTRQLARSTSKEVLLYVHGFNSDFKEPLQSVAELWHFMGRTALPIGYAWPASKRGIAGYAYDRESGEFTVYHLKQLLRLLGSCPDITCINILAHSRGGDIVADALRELNIQMRAAGEDPRVLLKINTVVLAAPDFDGEVASQRITAECLWWLVDRSVVYVSSKDQELRKASWLFNSASRVGALSPSDLEIDELALLQKNARIQLIDARIAGTGKDTHEYFKTNPAVSSDVILVLRDHRDPGGRHGRPLISHKDTFWEMYDNYPEKQQVDQAKR
jgi:esterase/lipase superfamily enzyme